MGALGPSWGSQGPSWIRRTAILEASVGPWSHLGAVSGCLGGGSGSFWEVLSTLPGLCFCLCCPPSASPRNHMAPRASRFSISACTV
eukprot:9480169-Pyramimonas_sp.AAC.1